MKIGILTYHRTLNYGGCMQALATRLLLEQLGHEVYYVDYWPNYHKNAYQPFVWVRFRACGIRGKIRYIRDCIKYYPYVKKRQQNFEAFHDRYIIPYCKPLTEKFDVIIYGSDQIWRKQKALNDYNPIYFACNNLNTRHHIAFSASMGVLPDSEADALKFIKMLKNFNRISVRESNLKCFLQEGGIKDVCQTLDPTLLLSTDQWNKYFETSKYVGPRYVLVYNLWGAVFDMESIQAYAKKNNLMIKTLQGEATQFDSETHITTAGPEEFIRLIKNADCIFTSSFHGLAFSLVYHKQVFASFGQNAERAKSLLQEAGIINHYLEPYTKFDTLLPEINYREVDSNLESIRKTSLDYLNYI